MNHTARPENWEYDNEEEKFWKHSYQVYLHEFDMMGYYVNADNEQDALDFAIDLAEEESLVGLFIENPTEEDCENHVGGGNHGLVLSSDNWSITLLD